MTEGEKTQFPKRDLEEETLNFFAWKLSV